MQIEERTYYEDEQKMESKGIYIFIALSGISMLAMAIGLLYNDNADWTTMGIVVGAVLFSDGFIFILFKYMKLNLAVSKKGLHYKMTSANTKNKMVSWDDVSAITMRKSPATGYGKKNKFRYGEVYAMNLRLGVELSFKNGKKIFFSLKEPDEFVKAIRKLELNIPIT